MLNQPTVLTNWKIPAEARSIMMLGEGSVAVGDDVDASDDKDEAGESGPVGGGDVEDGSRGWGLLKADRSSCLAELSMRS